MSGPLRAGEVADAAEVNRETLRYYERNGLIGRPARSVGGHRLYSPAVVRRLRTIKAAQRLGFSLAEIKGLLDGHGGVRATARGKLGQVEGRIAELRETAGVLREALELGCDGLEVCAVTPGCPLSG